MRLPDPGRQIDTSQSTRHHKRQEPKTMVVIDVAVPSASHIRKKLENYQDLKEELEGYGMLRPKWSLW